MSRINNEDGKDCFRIFIIDLMIYMAVVIASKNKAFRSRLKRFYVKVSYKNSSQAFPVYSYFISVAAGYSIRAAFFADSPFIILI
jgi:hypothetical protein